ncbi:uncharacterized protein LOC106351439 isoform X1 [Brassica napus]|uniref:uncharacterized protein LOC106351439 isoform X1 n=1 Tax=Brassica napus TaxID=3708 RepID=UPI000BBE3156|nr:uncharacterized protein LOC106351439 isoform X1 [Brassica napus]
MYFSLTLFNIVWGFCGFRLINWQGLLSVLQRYLSGKDRAVIPASMSCFRSSIFDELFKLMSRLDLMVDFSEFVFFMYRENGHESINKSFCSFESLFWLPSARICCIMTIEIMPKIHSLLYTVGACLSS